MEKPMPVEWDIFHIPYPVRMPNVFCYSEEYLELMGTFSSGDRDIDLANMQEKRDMYLTIAAMVEYHEQGAPIELQRPEDSIVIYRKLRQHLENWKKVVDVVINAPTPPIEDIRKMDRFSGAVHCVANRFTDNLFGNDSLFTRLGNRAEARRTRILRADSIIPTNAEVPIVPGHTAVSEAIARMALRRGQ